MSLKEELKEKDLLMIMDFSDNYKCSFQNEVQSTFFDQNLVTIHPIMCYYKQKLDDTDFIVKHSITCISNDLKHDSSLVKHFEERAFEKLQEQTQIDNVIQWTDGCAAQYKCKTSFAYISNQEKPVSRNYYETSHGKNVCDGLGAVVKNSCYRAMLTGKVLGCAEDVYDHCQAQLAHGTIVSEKGKSISIRHFVYVKKEDVDRGSIPEVTALYGTRKIHQLRNIGSPLQVESRNLSCFCRRCYFGDDTECQNSEYVDGWSKSDLTNTKCTSKAQASKGQTQPRKKSTLKEKSSVPALVTVSLPSSSETNTNNSGSDFGCEMDEMVEVRIDGERRSGYKLFIGKIVEIDDDAKEIQISFMEERKMKRQILYRWPEQEELSWVPMLNITKHNLKATLSDYSTNTRQLYDLK